MSDEQRVLPFRFPETKRQQERAGLCEICLDAPLRVIPCPHGAEVAVPETTVKPNDIAEMRPAASEPSSRGGCPVCGGWREEHDGVAIEHPFGAGKGFGPKP